MPQPNDLSRSLVALDQNSTIVAVIEMSQSSWLVAGMCHGLLQGRAFGSSRLGKSGS
jgi:transposase